MIPPPPWKERVWSKAKERVLSSHHLLFCREAANSAQAEAPLVLQQVVGSFHEVKLCHSLWQNTEVVG